jgi:uncharacterized membrane protein
LEPTVLVVGRVAGFVFLTFLPGLLILYVMGINPLERGHYLLYSVGLSMTFLAFLALFSGLLYSLAGVACPLGVENLLLNFVLWFIVLLVLVFLISKSRQEGLSKLVFQIDVKSLWFASLPLISIIGAYFVNFYKVNVVMFVLLFILAMIPFLACTKRISSRFYPIAVLAASLSLQFHENLITNYVIGCDIQATFYFANLVHSLQTWSPTLRGDSPLIIMSVVPSFYSSLLNISLDWAFKVLNSFLYALTPLCIFYVFRGAIGEKASFFASLFFAFQHGFIVYGTPCKQQLAELFMALILLVTFDEGLRRKQKAILSMLFSFAMINLHYGVPMIFLASLVLASAIIRLLDKNVNAKEIIFSPNYIMFFFVLFFSWLMLTAEGEIFDRLINVWKTVLNEAWLVISTQSVIHRSGRYIISEIPQGVLYQANMAIYLALTIFMIFGVLHTLWRILRRHEKITELNSLALSFAFFLFASFFITGCFGFDRMYVLSSVVLSGYIPRGYSALTNIFLKHAPSRSLSLRKQTSSLFLAMLLSAFLLFNSGVMYQLAGMPIESAISLNPRSNTLAYSDAEVLGAKWLTDNAWTSSRIFCDYYSCSLFKRFYDPSVERVFPLNTIVTLDQLTNVLKETDFIYIRSKALVDEAQDRPQYLGLREIAQIEFLTNKIYDNGDSLIYNYNF